MPHQWAGIGNTCDEESLFYSRKGRISNGGEEDGVDNSHVDSNKLFTQPEDVANACVFLASDMSAYITGQVLNVDGGMLT